MDLRERLQGIYDARGKLTPALVVEAARDATDPSDPLYGALVWDDQVAADSYRLEQAHRLIQSVRIVYRNTQGHDDGIRAFHAIRTEAGYVYEPVEKIVADGALTEILRRDMEREWRALKRRYDQFAEFYEMVHADLGDAA